MTLVSDISTAVLQRCNMENSNFIADSEMISYINGSASELYEELVHRFQDYFWTETYYNLPAGQNLIPLPADLFKFEALDILVADGYHSVRRWELNQRDRWSRPFNASHFGGIHYQVRGNDLYLMPQASAGGYLYRIWYVPRYVNKINDTDSMDDLLQMQNWHEYIIVDVCIKVLSKQETDAQVFIMQKQQLLDRIKKHAAQRDIGKPARLTPHDDDYQDHWTPRIRF